MKTTAFQGAKHGTRPKNWEPKEKVLSLNRPMVFDKPLKAAAARNSLLLVTSCVVSRVKYETQKGI